MKSALKNNNILMLLFICLSPVFMSLCLYLFAGDTPLQTSNHGELLKPPITADFIAHLTGAWQILVVHDGLTIGEPILQGLNRMHKILGPDQARVGVALITRPQAARYGLQSNRIYLSDPHNNVFMVYKLDANPLDIYHDLKRVLNASQIG